MTASSRLLCDCDSDALRVAIITNFTTQRYFRKAGLPIDKKLIKNLGEAYCKLLGAIPHTNSRYAKISVVYALRRMLLITPNPCVSHISRIVNMYVNEYGEVHCYMMVNHFSDEYILTDLMQYYKVNEDKFVGH